jgi:hypothetical protein
MTMERNELDPWLRRVDRLLGPVRGDHPATHALTAYAAGELSATRRAALAAHLASCDECRELERGARAGLQVLSAAPRTGAAAPLPPDAGLHHLITIPAPPAPRAYAATAEVLEAPLPEDRTMLVDEHGLRLVYFRRGGRALLGLFSEELAALEELSCTLDGAPLEVAEREPEALIVELGAVREILGRTLVVRLTLRAREHAWTFTLVSS